MTEPKRILLCRSDRIGDLILSTSCIEPLRRFFPTCELHFLVRSNVVPLLAGHPALDSVTALPDESQTAAQRLEQIKRNLGERAIDTLVMLHPDVLVERAAMELGIGRRIGYRHAKSACLTETVPDLRKSGNKHEAECVFDLLRLIGVDLPAAPLAPSLHVDERCRARALEKLGARPDTKGFAALHLSAHASKARLPAALMAEVAHWLTNARALDVVLLGAGRGDPTVREFVLMMDQAGTRVIDLYGATNLAETAWLLAAARLFISRDTGPAHLAAAVGCATLTVFVDPNRHMTSRRWRPLGPRVGVVEKPLRRRLLETDRRYEQRFLDNITAADIIAAAEALLQDTAVPL